ncbi:MAG: putative ABC transporter permease subunit [Bacillota bacterium]
MEYVYIILRRDLKSLFAPGGKKSLKSRLTLVAGSILYLALGVGVGYGSFRLFDYVRATLSQVPDLAAAIEINVLNGVSLFMTVMVLMTGIQTTYKSIYESDDIGFLMAQPVPVQAIFVSKFASSYVTLASLALVFGLPAYLGYGVAVGAGAPFYLLSLAGLALLLLVVHSVVTFMLLAAMRHLPGRKMKQLFIACSAIFGVLIVLLSQMASSRIAQTGDPSELLETIGRGQLECTWYLPSTWMVNAVLGASPEYGLNPLPYRIVLAITALGLSALSVRVSGSWFLAGWAGRTEETGPGAKKKRPVGRAVPRAWGGLPAGTYWTVLRKDLRLLFRDPLVWYNLVIAFITIGFFIFNQKSQFSGVQGGPDAAVGGSLLTFMAVLMGSVSGAQTGGISLSREGASFWLLRGSPADARSLFAAKYTYALLPPLILLGLSVGAGYVLGFAAGSVLPTLLTGLAMVFAVASAQILLDVYFPDFTLKVEFGSAKRGKGTGKLVTTMLGSMIVVMAMFFVLIAPSTQLPAKLLPGVSADQVTLYSRAVVVALGALATTAAATLGVGRMKRILTDM